MNNILKDIAEKARKREKADQDVLSHEIENPSASGGRRNFLKKAALGGIALGGMMNFTIEDTIAQTTSKVSRASSSF